MAEICVRRDAGEGAGPAGRAALAGRLEPGAVPTEAELGGPGPAMGWLEGLYGIQATLFAQQLVARQQLGVMRASSCRARVRAVAAGPGQERPGTTLRRGGGSQQRWYPRKHTSVTRCARASGGHHAPHLTSSTGPPDSEGALVGDSFTTSTSHRVLIRRRAGRGPGAAAAADGSRPSASRTTRHARVPGFWPARPGDHAGAGTGPTWPTTTGRSARPAGAGWTTRVATRRAVASLYHLTLLAERRRLPQPSSSWPAWPSSRATTSPGWTGSCWSATTMASSPPPARWPVLQSLVQEIRPGPAEWAACRHFGRTAFVELRTTGCPPRETSPS
jgi:hypothetical protein